MRRLSTVALSVALAASSSVTALAASGPTVSGLVLQRYHWNLTTGAPFGLNQQRLRLNVTGETARGVAYNLRVQATQPGAPSTPTPQADLYLASASFRLPYGATLSVGRQTLAWTVLDEFKGFADVVAAVAPGDDAILVTLPAGPAKVTVGYDFQFKGNEQGRGGEPGAVVAFAQMPLQTGGPKVTLGAQVIGPAQSDLRWGVNGSIALGAVTPYFEVGSGRADDLIAAGQKNDYRVLGVKFDVLRQMLGLDALVEYDMARSTNNLFARVGREVLPGLWVHLRRQTNGQLLVRTELSVAF